MKIPKGFYGEGDYLMAMEDGTNGGYALGEDLRDSISRGVEETGSQGGRIALLGIKGYKFHDETSYYEPCTGEQLVQMPYSGLELLYHRARLMNQDGDADAIKEAIYRTANLFQLQTFRNHIATGYSDGISKEISAKITRLQLASLVRWGDSPLVKIVKSFFSNKK